MEILSVVQIMPNVSEASPLIIGALTFISILVMYISAYCINDYKINYAAIGTFCLAFALTVAYIGLGLMNSSPVEAKVRINDISVQEYQSMVENLDTYTLDEDVLTIRMSEQDFYRWYYERHEATISASTSSSIESKNG